DKAQNIAFATLTSANIDFLKVDKNDVSIVKMHRFTKPEFIPSTQPGEFSAAITHTNKIGFLDIKSDNDYVYALFSGKTLEKGPAKAFEGDTIYVFDWTGNLISRLKLDINISRMALSKENKKIYGFVDQVVPQIVTFELPNKF
ncbi:MAG: BF3164 family lipoprotein, partial [Runella sp.]